MRKSCKGCPCLIERKTKLLDYNGVKKINYICFWYDSGLPNLGGKCSEDFKVKPPKSRYNLYQEFLEKKEKEKEKKK